MHQDEIRMYCLDKMHCTESLPFDQYTLVFEVGGKIFAVLALDELNLALKATPDEVAYRLEHYAIVQPPRYFDKRYRHFVRLNQVSYEKLLKEWIDRSYELIVESLPKKTRIALNL